MPVARPHPGGTPSPTPLPRAGLSAARVAGWLVAGPVLAGWLFACTNSGLGDDSGHSGAAPTVAADCPFVGEWKLASVACSAFEEPDWSTDYGNATMDIRQDENGGCIVNASVTASTCNQDEKWHFSAPVGSAVEIQIEGVVGCQPAACEFPGGAVCVRDSGARDIPDGYVAFVGTQLQARDLLSETVPGCSLDVVTTWDPK